MRSRIELVLDYATARGLREGPNPARWREHRLRLSPTALKLLLGVRSEQPNADAIIFRGTKGPRSDMGLTAVICRMKVAATGFAFASLRSEGQNGISCTEFGSTSLIDPSHER